MATNWTAATTWAVAGSMRPVRARAKVTAGLKVEPRERSATCQTASIRVKANRKADWGEVRCRAGSEVCRMGVAVM